jgi:hypothetical protein
MQRFEFTTKRSAALLAGVALVVLLFVQAGTANARTFSVTSGDATYQVAFSVFPVLGAFVPSLAWGPVPGAYATLTGSNPATLTLQPGVFNKSGFQVTIPIGPTLPSYVQFTTNQGIYAPISSAAVFKPGAPATQAGRQAADFAWCPGAANNPACTTVGTGGGNGTRGGIVKYTTNPNQFGGTMKVLITGTLSFSKIINTVPSVQIAHFGGPSGQVAAGKGYDFTQMYPGTSVPVTGGAVISSGGIITQPGTFLFSTPGGITSTGHGFPFTTGMVYLKVFFAPPTYPFSTISASGSDNRTPQGAGNITLVAGQLGSSSLVSSPQLMTISLNLGNQFAVPSIGRVGLATLLGLMACGGGFFALRSQRATA